MQFDALQHYFDMKSEGRDFEAEAFLRVAARILKSSNVRVPTNPATLKAIGEDLQ